MDTSTEYLDCIHIDCGRIYIGCSVLVEGTGGLAILRAGARSDGGASACG